MKGNWRNVNMGFVCLKDNTQCSTEKLKATTKIEDVNSGPSSDQSHWTCVQCTLINTLDAQFCSVCDAPAPSLQPSVSIPKTKKMKTTPTDICDSDDAADAATPSSIKVVKKGRAVVDVHCPMVSLCHHREN